ncbi:hypothetical protein BGW80DRAFT_1349933, partial [Lactifluus volemus]
PVQLVPATSTRRLSSICSGYTRIYMSSPNLSSPQIRTERPSSGYRSMDRGGSTTVLRARFRPTGEAGTRN